jgi:hypothetical protein
MSWAGNIEHMRKIRNWLRSLKGKYHSEDVGGDGRIILKWILGK